MDSALSVMITKYCQLTRKIVMIQNAKPMTKLRKMEDALLVQQQPPDHPAISPTVFLPFVMTMKFLTLKGHVIDAQITMLLLGRVNADLRNVQLVTKLTKMELAPSVLTTLHYQMIRRVVTA